MIIFVQKLKLFCLVSLLIIPVSDIYARNNSQTQSKNIDKLVNTVMHQFDVPGVAVGVIKDNKIVHIKGYGIANIDLGNKVNKNTIFKIASNTKAFTSASIAILVDQGKLKWTDPVVKYLPEFKMYDPWVTKRFNIRDLLTHRSGLRIGAGDLMLWPEPTKFTRQDIIKNLQYLKPVASFRDKYAYDNLLYIVAGEIVAKVSGTPWKQFVENNIFKPLAMENCFAGGIDTSKYNNVVAPHTIVDNKLLVDKPNLMSNKTSLMAAAGGIKCSASDLTQWLFVQLNKGLSKSGVKLFSEKQSNNMWKPVTTLPLSTQAMVMDKTHYKGYALGWRISDYQGYWKISHTGTLSGSMSQMVIIPDENFAVVILTNQQSSAARNSLAKGITQLFLNIPQVDWVKYYTEQIKAKQKASKSSKQIISLNERNIPKNGHNKKLLGNYIDPWFGKISLTRKANKVYFSSEKSPRLKGEVFFNNKNQWWVKWNDRSFNADARLNFEVQKASGKTLLKMEAISDTADWSFDFEDLSFTKL